MGRVKKTLEETDNSNFPVAPERAEEELDPPAGNTGVEGESECMVAETDEINSDIPAAPERAEEELDPPAGDVGIEKASECMVEKKYEIVCRNPINEAFGGVSFHEGIAHTSNGFTASWFNNKEGYIVKEV